MERTVARFKEGLRTPIAATGDIVRYAGEDETRKPAPSGFTIAIPTQSSPAALTYSHRQRG
jgi:hypothetical protein